MIKNKIIFVLIVQRQQFVPIVKIAELLILEVGVQVKNFWVVCIDRFQLAERGAERQAIAQCNKAIIVLLIGDHQRFASNGIAYRTGLFIFAKKPLGNQIQIAPVVHQVLTLNEFFRLQER